LATEVTEGTEKRQKPGSPIEVIGENGYARNVNVTSVLTSFFDLEFLCVLCDLCGKKEFS
jgi:hypothetical protein